MKLKLNLILVTAFFLVSCTKNQFNSGDGDFEENEKRPQENHQVPEEKKTPEKLDPQILDIRPKDEKQTLPPRQLNPQTPLPQTPKQPEEIILKPQNPDIGQNAPRNEAPPPRQQGPQDHPQSIPEQSEGSLKFRAVLFTNMEHRAHATDSGVYAVVRDSGGDLVAAAPMTLQAAINGRNLGGAGYPVTELNLNLTVMNSQTNSDTGKLSICRVKDLESYECERQSAGRSGDRPIYWYDRAVNYQVSGDQIRIANRAGIRGNGPNVDYGLSFAHPIAMAAIGGDVNDYTDASSPLVLDLTGNKKLDLINIEDSTRKVYFDHSADGTKLRTGWVQKTDGLLALDVDGDGKISSGRELFGEFSHQKGKDKQDPAFFFESGFAALAQYDDNQNGRIDAKDSIFSDLRVWVDKNENGISEKSTGKNKELYSLNELEIQSISLDHQSTGKPFEYMMVEGNEVRFVGDYQLKSGETRLVGDVWFREDHEDKK